MKKIICIIIINMIIISMTAFCENNHLDITQMSLDELILLQIKIQEEIISRDPYNEMVFFPGIYYSGKHFEPGTYIIHVLSSEIDNWAIIEICDDNGNFIDSRVPKVGQNLQFDLEEGYKLSVMDGNVTLIKR